jgi:hypothetical protein
MGRRKQRRKGRRMKRIRHRRDIEMKGKEWRHEEENVAETEMGAIVRRRRVQIGTVKGEPGVTHVSAGQP